MTGRALGFIGTGHIAAAVIEGIAGQPGWDRPILVSPRNAARAADLAARFGCVRIAESNADVAAHAATVILALRPQDAAAGLAGVSFRADQSIVSLMAMIPMARLRDLVRPASSIVRTCLRSTSGARCC